MGSGAAGVGEALTLCFPHPPRRRGGCVCAHAHPPGGAADVGMRTDEDRGSGRGDARADRRDPP